MIIVKQIDNLFYVYDVSKCQLYCLNMKLAKQFLATIYKTPRFDLGVLLNGVFNENGKTVLMIFRIGHDSKLPIKTLKLPPVIVFED